ncbi:MAG TPA: CDP-diacylglycerol O-phosphatidyltransferase [Thermodesulfobacteriota bacterium]
MKAAAAYLVHLYTASGAVLALFALDAGLRQRPRAAFLLLTIAVFVDASDGTLARAARVKERARLFDGARMDDIVDYLTFVFVPMVLAYAWGLLPAEGGLLVTACPLLASAMGFARVDAKTADHFFTGFPSYWNVVVLYAYLWGWPPWVNAALLLVLSALVFVPVRYVYPSRMPVLRRLTNGLGVLWGVALLELIRQIPEPSRWLLWASAAYPAYYVALSLYLTGRWSSRGQPPA